jgi:predicted RNA methylase
MVNIDLIIKNLREFYPLYDKKIIHAGIGGGILTGYTQDAKEVTAIDSDEKILIPLSEKIIRDKLEKKFTIIISDFLNFRGKADLTFFEFCMHEMQNHNEVITHAKSISDTVLIIDHGRDSDWAYYTCETEKIEDSINATEKFSIKKRERYEAEQIFSTYEELYNKLSILGEESIKRIKIFENKTNFRIEMPYEIYLL